jgi:nucleotide-binding universal stress UspA family protein
LPQEILVMLTIGEREIAGPGTGADPADGGSSFRRVLVPVRSPGEAGLALAAAARICGMTNGVLRLVHVRTCDPPLRSPARFYRETPGEAAAVLEEALVAAWACGGPRATTAVVDARHGDVALAIAWQAAAWPADLIVLTRHPNLAITRLARGSLPDQVMRQARCPVLAIPRPKTTASTAPPDVWHAETGPSGAGTPSRAGHRLPAGPGRGAGWPAPGSRRGPGSSGSPVRRRHPRQPSPERLTSPAPSVTSAGPRQPAGDTASTKTTRGWFPWAVLWPIMRGDQPRPRQQWNQPRATGP